MTNVTTQFITGFGGAKLAVHVAGPQDGWPLVLVHGLFSSAAVNWVKYGHAARLADAGYRVIMPDLRAHGHSAAPHDPAAYPEDVLVDDLLALIEAFGLEEGGYDLGGFSLGARTVTRAVLAGAAPRRLVLGGMGLEGLAGWAKRSAFFIDVIDRFGTIKQGDPAYYAQQFMKVQAIDPVAARLLLGSVDDTPPDELLRLTLPVLVVCGEEDMDNGSAPRLARRLPNARYVEIPGTHMSSVTQRQLSEAILAFVAE
ncbi:alpha/beta fold hydrolase [Novosphingobium sp. FSY-8]|uniref:Alpha/beta fold hydrolase n=1 Tax=Novosphingobium ovatum TaxID=1908523 RepID=A0ABW9XBL6_9SPHN|nr:alpha/beta fold hydrolase [Novosphingobium ovatum]NBC35924.1 alpha/beta fold hydrolase [Novosphingobium ovatum]